MNTAKGSSCRRGQAITLIEVMVVLAIVSVLASLLLPAVSRARAKVRRVECQHRLKQWSAAFLAYADDNDGWIARECYEPLGEVTINNWSQVRGRVRPDGTSDSDDVWYNALPGVLRLPPTTAYANPTRRREFFDSSVFLHCPSARFPAHAYRPTFQFPLFSLAMNSQLIRSGPSVQLSALESHDPARTVTFLENRLEGEARVHPAQESTHLGQPGAYANRFGSRHERGGNLAFLDGHVAWFQGTQVVETRESSPLLGGPIVPPAEIVWEVYPP